MRYLWPLLVALALPAWAETPPAPRPDIPVVVMSSRGAIARPVDIQPGTSHRPIQRRSTALRDTIAIAAVLRTPMPRIDSAGLVRRSDRPDLRDADLIPVLGGRARRGGGLCGRRTIQGEVIPAVPGPGACGIPDAVRITQVAGVDLMQPARMDCDTARALDDWVQGGVIPNVGNTGGGAATLRVAAGYACRTRNNQPGARISEHGRGRAIDISAIQLANGQRISVLQDWNRGDNGRILRALHRAACGPFGTVLGPDSDRFHRDHFHFDTARYRSGSYCR
ncbi:MAG: extensin family protein [Pseudomonadota bacterium]